MKFKIALFTAFVCAFSSLSQAADSIVFLKSIPALDGDVNSSWQVDTFSNELTIGRSGLFLPADHKAIITYDTSVLDSTRTPRHAYVTLNFSNLPAGKDGPATLQYLQDNMKIEVAGPFGFGGNNAITALDYYAAPVATIDKDQVFFGFVFHAGFDILPYVNDFGTTQIAISLGTNPENIAVKFHSGEVVGNDLSGGPSLAVFYE